MEVAMDIEPFNQAKDVRAFWNSVKSREVGVELTKSPIHSLGDLQRVVNRFVQIEELAAPWNSRDSSSNSNKKRKLDDTVHIVSPKHKSPKANQTDLQARISMFHSPHGLEKRNTTWGKATKTSQTLTTFFHQEWHVQ